MLLCQIIISMTIEHSENRFPVCTQLKQATKRLTLKIRFLSLIFIILLSNLSFAGEIIIEVITIYNRPASEIQPLIGPMLENTDRVIADGSNLIY